MVCLLFCFNEQRQSPVVGKEVICVHELIWREEKGRR